MVCRCTRIALLIHGVILDERDPLSIKAVVNPCGGSYLMLSVEKSAGPEEAQASRHLAAGEVTQEVA